MELKPIAQNIVESNQIGVELQITDAKLALTFLDMAETSGTVEDRERRIGEAGKAHRSIHHFLARLTTTVEQHEWLLSYQFVSLTLVQKQPGIPMSLTYSNLL